MTEKIDLNATTRTVVGKKVKRSRARGQLPAVVYGHGKEATPLFIDAKLYKKAYQKAGTSTLVDLVIDDNKPIKVLFQQPQYHHIFSEPIHADLYAVNMKEKIETDVPINFIGVSPAVEELEGNFISSRDELAIRCLPSDLISSIDVDISVLATFDDQIHVSDIKLSGDIEVMDDPEELVASVSAPRSEEELEAELAQDDDAAEKAAVEELGGETAEEEGEEGSADDSSERSE